MYDNNGPRECTLTAKLAKLSDKIFMGNYKGYPDS